MRFAITGTPGTGKTSVAKELSKILCVPLIKSSDLLKKAAAGFDKKRDCMIVDEQVFGKLLSKITGDFIAECHLAHNIEPSCASVVIVLTCNQTELKKRLEKKGWSAGKIRENLDAENMKVVLGESMDLGHRIVEFDTSGKTPKESAKELAGILAKKINAQTIS